MILIEKRVLLVGQVQQEKPRTTTLFPYRIVAASLNTGPLVSRASPCSTPGGAATDESPLTSTHLLILDEPFAHDLIDGGFHESGLVCVPEAADRFAETRD